MDLILKDRYKINNLNQGITLKEALDGIAYSASIDIVETKELSKVGIFKGDKIKLIDGNNIIFSGVIWDLNKNKKSKKISLSCRERTVYIEESEDEYLFGEGTATSRINQYCKDWGIPTESLLDTKLKLSKAVYRKDTIFSMMKKDLKETAVKGGDLYKLRMANKLNLFKLGSNTKIYKLESVLEDIDEKYSLSGLVTQVKVLGKNDKDDKKSPIIGTYKKNTDKFGTIQKILQDEKIDNSSKAKSAAEGLFNTGEDSISIRCKDIIGIRAGDKISLYGKELYVVDITHELSNVPKMSLSLSTLDIIRKRFYSDGNI